MMNKLQAIDLEKLVIKKGTRRDTWFSLGGGNRTDFYGCTEGRWG